jgi:glycosyltransferase involved in cell wall biosynthesis
MNTIRRPPATRPEAECKQTHYHRMMKIALDATPLTILTGGERRYAAELSRALAETFPEDEFWLLSDQPFDHPAPDVANLKTGQGPRNPLERRWWLWGLQSEISRLRIDLFHGTDFAVPYLAARPSVLTLHDLSPWLDPGWHAQAERVRQRTPMLLRLGLATLVITPSEAVRTQAIERFRLQANRVVATPLAASSRFRPVVCPPPERPFFLYVGTLEPRKNLSFLLDAWRETRTEHGVDLVLAGRRREDSPEIAAEPGLRVLGPVPDDDLPRLYSSALAFVYPSLYEGFGLPVLEAMQCGAAVIASSDPAITEVAGGAATLLDVKDTRAWGQALVDAARYPERIAELRSRGLSRAAEFSWTKTARLTREAYGEAARRFRRRA